MLSLSVRRPRSGTLVQNETETAEIYDIDLVDLTLSARVAAQGGHRGCRSVAQALQLCGRIRRREAQSREHTVTFIDLALAIAATWVESAEFRARDEFDRDSLQQVAE
jgi:hypothetical protein